MITDEQRRSARLLLWPDQVPPGGAEERAASAPFASRRPAAPRRLVQALASKRGRLDWGSGAAAPLAAARRQALGAAAEGPPRALVRVDEFPHARAFDPAGSFGSEAFRRFHSILAEAEVPYLLAATPRVSRDYLDPNVAASRPLDESEREVLLELGAGSVVFALHGLDHRTRHLSPRRRSELLGLGRDAIGERIDRARGLLAEAGVQTPVFVAPFNRFDASQYDLLAERFEVVCGGPESVRLLGFAPTPVWRGGAVYLPSYPPLYQRASVVLEELHRLERDAAGIWAPITLHWGWELKDDFEGLRRLCERLAAVAVDWRDFLAAVRSSAEPLSV